MKAKTIISVALAMTLIASTNVAISAEGLNATKTETSVSDTATKLALSTTSLKLTEGKAKTLKVSGTTSTIKWSTADKSIATVSSKGQVVAKGVGSTYVYATVDGKKLKCKVTVETSKIIPAKSSVTITEGDSVTIDLTLTDVKSVKVGTTSKVVATATYSNKKVTIKGVKAGTAKIKVYDKSDANTCRWITVTVEEPKVVVEETVEENVDRSVFDFDPQEFLKAYNAEYKTNCIYDADYSKRLQGYYDLREQEFTNGNLLRLVYTNKNLERKFMLYINPADIVDGVHTQNSGVKTSVADLQKQEEGVVFFDTVEDYKEAVSKTYETTNKVLKAYSDTYFKGNWGYHGSVAAVKDIDYTLAAQKYDADDVFNGRVAVTCVYSHEYDVYEIGIYKAR